MVTDTVHWRTAKAMVGWSSLLMNSWCHGWLKQSTGEQLRPWLAEAVYWWIAKAMVGVCSLLANSWGDGSLMQSTCEQRRLCLLIQSTGDTWCPGWVMQPTRELKRSCLADEFAGEQLRPRLAYAFYWRTVEVMVVWCSLLVSSGGHVWVMQSTGEDLNPWLADSAYARTEKVLFGWWVFWWTVDVMVGVCSLLADSRCPDWLM